MAMDDRGESGSSPFSWEQDHVLGNAPKSKTLFSEGRQNRVSVLWIRGGRFRNCRPVAVSAEIVWTHLRGFITSRSDQALCTGASPQFESVSGGLAHAVHFAEFL